MAGTSRPDWDRLCDDGWRSLTPGVPLVVVGMASCGRAAGAEAVYQRALQMAEMEDRHLAVIPTGCLGFCQREPLVEIRLPNGSSSLYGPVTPDRITELIGACSSQIQPDEGCIGRFPALSLGTVATDALLAALPDHPFYRGQVRLVTRRCGRIDPTRLDHALAVGAYRILGRVVTGMQPMDVIRVVQNSALRGRGGAGYPTGLKWQAARDAAGPTRYLICNADEGDPGAYMDRALLEGDPHAVLEGMMIGGYAIGAKRGIVFVRSEYPLAMATMQQAIDDALQYGFLGKKLFGSDFDFEIELVAGAGAFVSGEETAMIAAIEGRIAEPRPRPPYPADQGLYGKPTVINNVETWATIPILLEWGASRFAQLGTSKSKGTKVFSLVGAVARTGLVEVPLGTTLRSVVEDIGGGARPGRSLKALQTGGPSGGCLSVDLMNLPADYETLTDHGSIMGSGGLVVMDDTTCMVDIARYFLEFTAAESCGKCTPCREGLTQMHRILTRICGGKGTNTELEHLLELAEVAQRTSLCGLGKSASNPVLTVYRYFREELLAHVLDRRCPAGVCQALIHHVINSEDCTGCGACVGVCPAQAIQGSQDTPHQLDTTICIQCGACKAVCRTGAIQVQDRYAEASLSSL